MYYMFQRDFMYSHFGSLLTFILFNKNTHCFFVLLFIENCDVNQVCLVRKPLISVFQYIQFIV